MHDPDVIKKIDVEFLKQTAHLLRKGKIDIRLAQQAGKELIALLPFQNDEDMKTKIKSYTEKYPDYGNLFVAVLESEDHKEAQTRYEKMNQLIVNKQFDAAIKAAGR